MNFTCCRVALLAMILAAWVHWSTSPVHAQTEPGTTDQDPGSITASEVDSGSMDTEQLARVDWLEEARKGGITMVALLLLSVAGVTFCIERFLTLRISNFIPTPLAEEIRQLSRKRDFAGMKKRCEGNRTTLAKSVLLLIDYRQQPYDTISMALGDSAGREIRNQIARTSPLAVIAALAPLLGLLGTMIGMIESFKLVSIYGDDGGASMLADSIAKALITTAGGLVVAIPTLGAYHYFRHRINTLTNEIESEIDHLLRQFLARDQKPKAHRQPKPESKSPQADTVSKRPPSPEAEMAQPVKEA